jgi:hypothetical protein
MLQLLILLIFNERQLFTVDLPVYIQKLKRIAKNAKYHDHTENVTRVVVDETIYTAGYIFKFISKNTISHGSLNGCCMTVFLSEWQLYVWIIL